MRADGQELEVWGLVGTEVGQAIHHVLHPAIFGSIDQDTRCVVRMRYARTG
jgi:hypothetical protein